MNTKAFGRHLHTLHQTEDQSKTITSSISCAFSITSTIFLISLVPGRSALLFRRLLRRFLRKVRGVRRPQTVVCPLPLHGYEGRVRRSRTRRERNGHPGRRWCSCNGGKARSPSVRFPDVDCHRSAADDDRDRRWPRWNSRWAYSIMDPWYEKATYVCVRVQYQLSHSTLLDPESFCS